VTKNKGVDYPYVYGRPETAIVVLGQSSTNTLEEMLFEHEQNALAQAKEWEVSQYFPDKFIVTAIFSRKFDMERVLEMLTGCREWMVAENYVDWPTYDAIEKIFLFNSSWYTIPGARAKNGCGIMYMRMKNMLTKDDVEFDLPEAMMRMMLWNNTVGMFVDGMDIHRNGFYWICDMKGYGWKHVDLDMQKKMSKIRDHFPMRLKAMFMLNTPAVMKAIMVVLKPFMQKKVRKRMISLSTTDTLLEYIEADQLATEFGGTLEYDIDQHRATVEEFVERHEAVDLQL